MGDLASTPPLVLYEHVIQDAFWQKGYLMYGRDWGCWRFEEVIARGPSKALETFELPTFIDYLVVPRLEDYYDSIKAAFSFIRLSHENPEIHILQPGRTIIIPVGVLRFQPPVVHCYPYFERVRHWVHDCTTSIASTPLALDMLSEIVSRDLQPDLMI